MNTQWQNIIEHLAKKRMAGYVVNDRQELLLLLKKQIAAHSTVGCGDSVTLEQTGVFDFLRRGPYQFLDKHQENTTTENKRDIYIRNFSSDIFITGTNALTIDGKLFNIDGNGSRVAPMIYGPKKVIVVVGKNKIVQNVEQAINRTRQIAAPLDAQRLGKNTPCAKLGRCVDCQHTDRICNSFVLIAGQRVSDRIKVIIVNEDLGY